ncbi:MAG: hypothetical protein HY934_04650 [Candidatus Firestonebacteria bacterium]|nr:hypothetical protein [Candidatus Firestonebacteria bacterium]
MTLISDAIIYNKQGFSTTKETDLIDELKITLGDNIKINKAFIKTGETENFVSIWKLRRPSETCFQMGSCFLINGLISSDKAKLLELEKNGIGERRGEGFGRIIFNFQKVEKLDIETKEDEMTKQKYWVT